MARKYNWATMDAYMRVQMPIYWVEGDRYGTVIATGKRAGSSIPFYLIHLDKSDECAIAKADDCQEVYGIASA